MLTFQQIKDNFPEDIFNRNPRAVLVEYLQYELLDSIFKQKGSEHLSFIGGTAIRIIYNSGRFSEDLDFDNFGINFNDFKKLLSLVVTDMTAKGFGIEFRMIRKLAYHCYIRFPDLLFNNKLSPNKNEKILIRIDTVPKEKDIIPKITVINGFNIYANIFVNPIDIFLSQKIIAILQRKREKGRDFYDVSYLLGITDPNFDYIKRKCGVEKENLKNKILERTASFDMTQLSADVKPLLVKDSDIERVKTFRDYIAQRL